MAQVVTRVREYLEDLLPQTICQPGRFLKYPFMTVSGEEFYSETLFLWDHHHAAMRLAHQGNPEFLRYQIDNLLEHQKGNGFLPNRIHVSDGPVGDTPPFHAQPFLFQAAAMYLNQTQDKTWAAGVFRPLCNYLTYYENRQSAPGGLFRWAYGWMSGLDNDVVHLFQPDTIITPDINAWIYLEYLAAANVARILGEEAETDTFTDKAQRLKGKINEYLWSDEFQSYTSWNLCTASHVFTYPGGVLPNGHGKYTYQSCSNLIPLYAGLASKSQAKEMIETYVLSPNHFRSPYGIRSLSASSEFYNNAVWGNPPRYGYHGRPTNSNWQGPVWSPLVYFVAHALDIYGYKPEARELSESFLHTVDKALKDYGTLAENFHAETGRPLYGKSFASWNMLIDILYEELTTSSWIMNMFINTAE